ncbi:MAG TPA: CpsB/CapC family capsule biosynthesis tyrosine phosphatase [Tepidisphaeraceae bacterium]|jgi:protein-tyrosine phosphatase|nr:CpsB/CapC family capsule biosynthesis tyrosine phosphatase [Tepidisphaeraceae bacterium]
MHGRIDVHAHLLPGVDDGCADVAESISCGRMLVEARYTHAFCTPHIWPNLPNNNPTVIPQKTEELQGQFDEAGVKLKLLPGGELNLRAEMVNWPKEQIPSYGMKGKYCLFDLWVDQLPPFFWPVVAHLQSTGLIVIVAHPERMRVVQDDLAVVDNFLERGLFLQGNLQCLSDMPGSPTRRTVEQLLRERRYFLLGTDAHRPETLPMRLAGLQKAMDLAGREYIDQLTMINPQVLIS